jgi:hypothetical protein
LPKDFDERYFQAAPDGQQLSVPNAPMEVMLGGFTPDGSRLFLLPHFEAPVHVYPKRADPQYHAATLDTIVFEPDLERFTMTWRVSRPLQRDIFEIAQVVVGKRSKEWWYPAGTTKKSAGSETASVASEAEPV